MKYLPRIIALTLILLVTAQARAVEPNQVLIIGNSADAESIRLANFYARQRQIPARNILMLKLPEREQITRRQYDELIAGPIRGFIKQQKLEEQIKILVTMYGVPLRVGPAQPTPAQRTLAQQVKERYHKTFAELETAIDQLRQIVGITAPLPTTLPSRHDVEQFQTHNAQMIQAIQSAYQSVIPVVQRMTNPVEQEMAANQLVRLRVLIEGQIALAAADPNQFQQHPQLVQALQNMEKQYLALMSVMPDDRDFAATMQLARNFGGLFLELKTLYEDYQRLIHRDSLSAVDSELTLVLWDSYVLTGRLPNALNPRFADHPIVADRPPTLMVSRLDAPTPEIVERMITDSVVVQKTGLKKGTFYIDARGLKNPDGFFVYDEDLRNLSGNVRKHTEFPVVLDNRAEVFGPDSCPDTALYCGWYSLRKYVPAFTFVPGSVGYHIASFEATTLRDPESNQWVKRMLENGIAATLGPVDEPFLDAFPLPSEFFGLLMTGKYNLAEVFFKTNRYNSWRIILIGDPLYNPFAANPLMDEENIELGPLQFLLMQ